ncbi:unnamed protein product [Symbiodinium necroappetens]|uniref:Uncharacterized protein n=1 Tax=Symbiodinium necroappetens TaxID=1628268 RepID=A0A812SH10_9DINO|nr:unnamed protein product [Symbiodinium necroappetens]
MQSSQSRGAPQPSHFGKVFVLDELDELLPKRKYVGRKLARYQDPGMWPAEGLVKRLMRNNERETLQVVAASATAYRSSRLRLEKVLKQDKLKRFPIPLPRLDPQRSSAASLEAGWERVPCSLRAQLLTGSCSGTWCRRGRIKKIN